MKKIFTTLCLISSAYFAGAQTIVLLDEAMNVVSNTIIDIPMTVSSNHNEEILSYNPTASDETQKVLRTIYTVDPADQTQFCWGGLCYGFSTNLSSLSATIPTMDTISFNQSPGMGFHAIFNSSAVTGTRVVHYKFYDTTNPNDTVGVTLRYNIVAGINDESKANGSISNAFPNPSSTTIAIKYDLNEFATEGKIVFHDMLGKAVKEIVLNDKQGTAKVNVSEMNAGIYFYTFMVNDKVLSTKKLVISK
ncbi:MAG: T9SS type A sorting domain-containing protein [Bacteroidota bacterium]|nr:T9SS type A sorting domain-containing protein [Bacteroidota bacterium]